MTKAVVPAAGYGTRMRPMTLGVPKELFPLGDSPLIAHAVRDATAAGIREICVVLRRGKESIRDYLVATVPRRVRLCFVYQRRKDGLGGALRAARTFADGERFVMVIPDQHLRSKRGSACAQLLRCLPSDGPLILSSMVKVPRAERRFFAGARGFGISVRRPRPGRPYPVSRLLRTGREVCGFGRTVYPPEIFRYLGSRYADPGTGEVDLWRTFQALPSRIQHRAVLLDGQPCDTGTFAGYYHYLPRFVRGWAAP